MSTTTPSTIGVPSLTRRGRLGRRALTGVRILLAIQFAAGGLMKLGGAESMVTLFDDIGAGQWFRYLVGTLEVAGAVGLVIPRLVGAAALGLTALMTGALLTRATMLDGIPIIETLFLIAAAAIAYDRRAQTRALAARVLR